MLLHRFLTGLLLLALLLPAEASHAADPIVLRPVSYLPFVFAPNRAGPEPPCQVVYQNPADGSYILKNSDFETHWTIKNTSEILWRSDSIDIRFTSGDRLHTGSDTRDLPFDVAPGRQIEVVVNMHAGDTPGSYTASWALLSGLSPVCSFHVAITVQ